MISYTKDIDDELVIPVGLGPNVEPPAVMTKDPTLEVIAGNSNSLANIKIPEATIWGQYEGLFKNKTNLEIAPDFSDIISIPATADACYYEMFSGTSITEADMSSLESVYGEECFLDMFSSNNYLKKVDIGSLSIIDRVNATRWMFYGCPNLEEIRVHPNALESTSFNPFYRSHATAVKKVELTALATRDMHFYFTMNRESVYHILVSLDLNNPHTVEFAGDAAQIATDYEDGRILDAYDAVTAAGWDIQGLTINPYSQE